MLWHSLAIASWSSIPFLGAIHLPTLVVSGAHDRVVPPENSQMAGSSRWVRAGSRPSRQSRCGAAPSPTTTVWRTGGPGEVGDLGGAEGAGD